MPLSHPRDVLGHARAHSYLAGAFFVFNADTADAVLEAAESERSPVFIQVGVLSRRFNRCFGTFLDDLRRRADRCPVPIVLQHDHCLTPEDCIRAVDEGIASVMFDGSALPYEENVEKTRAVAAYVHKRAGWLEAELGRIPGFEENVFAAHTLYTDPELAADFVEKTGCDALAVAVGTAHGGVAAQQDLTLDFELLQRLRRRLGDYPLVLHGAASLPQGPMDLVNRYGGRVARLRMASEEDIRRTAQYGACKANMDVDNFLCYTGALRRYLHEKPEEYNPVALLEQARDAFRDEVRHKMRCVLMSAGRA